ncbi:unnamed protein product [Polarella glacialis]|uniref:Ion transport domain-containing protein n=1 Tax=Polarella glacialis TaxID=89957 RepID=A0A813LYF7_POLGL|nr:unnamed protein product [Polarella glacialis]CAE8741672.1 unnamed protein product [Polarella glacialis]
MPPPLASQAADGPQFNNYVSHAFNGLRADLASIHAACAAVQEKLAMVENTLISEERAGERNQAPLVPDSIAIKIGFILEAEPVIPQSLIGRWPISEVTEQSFTDLISEPNSLVKKKQQLKLLGLWEEANALASESPVVDPAILNLKKEHSNQCLRTGSSFLVRMQTIQLNTEGLKGELQSRVCAQWDSFAHPHSNARIFWNVAGAMLVFYDALTIPVIVGWEMSLDNGPLYAMFLFALTFWILDLLLTFHTGYYERGILQMSPRAIARNYMRTWLVLDLSILMLDFMTLLVPQGSDGLEGGRLARTVRVIRVLRLLRVLKLDLLLQPLEEILGFAHKQWVNLIVAIVKIFMAIIMICHVLACLWYFIGKRCWEVGMPSWLYANRFDSTTQGEQYLVSLHWVLGQFTPASQSIQPENYIERLFNIFVIFFSLFVMGSCISKMSASIQEILRVNSEKEKRKRSVNLYLGTNKVNVELSMRILRFVDYALKKQSAAFLDRSLVSETLVKELNMSQRGHFLLDHCLFLTIKAGYPDFFCDLCGVLDLQVFEQDEVIFSAGLPARSMHIAGHGIYTLTDHLQESHTFDMSSLGEQAFIQSRYFAEGCLYANVIHTSTLKSGSFADTYTLSATNFAACTAKSPGCGKMIYQYALAFIAQMHGSEDLAGDVQPASMAENACKGTSLFQLLHLQDSLKIGKFRIQSLQNYSEVEELTVPQQIETLLKFVSEDGLSSQQIADILEKLFPELDPEYGTHVCFFSSKERSRAIASMVSVIWLIKGRHDEFARPQSPVGRMSKEVWEKLQEFVLWTGIASSSELLHTVLVFLAVKGLGKAKNLVQQLPAEYQAPEAAVIHMMKVRRNVMPSVSRLSASMQDLLEYTFQVEEQFRLGQFLQGENSPGQLSLLKNFIREKVDDEPRLLKTYLFSGLGMMAGLHGHFDAQSCWGSRFMDENKGRMVTLSLQALKHLEVVSPHAVYWGYMSSCAQKLRVRATSASELALVRLSNLCRCQEPQDCQDVRDAWMQLDVNEQDLLSNYLLADGINDEAILFPSLPQCLVNARNNANVGLAAMLVLLVELIERMWLRIRSAKDASKMFSLDLSDLATFAAAVRNDTVFKCCLEDAKFTVQGPKLQLTMTGKNWNRAEDTEAHAMSMTHCMHQVLRKQKSLENMLAKVFGEQTGGEQGLRDQPRTVDCMRSSLETGGPTYLSF